MLIALVFVFASFGVQMYGGELAACNDPSKHEREDCYGIFFQQVWISNSLDIEDDDPPGKSNSMFSYFTHMVNI